MAPAREARTLKDWYEGYKRVMVREYHIGESAMKDMLIRHTLEHEWK